MKRPSFQFYPSDWLRDTALRTCSTGARGLWIDMICFMHQGTPYGHLKVGEKVIHAENLARMVGESVDQVKGWIEELSEAKVFDLTDDGVICSRRMIRDEEVRNARAEGGKKGGNPALMGSKDGQKVNQEDKQNPTPSSSSSSSSSLDLVVPNGTTRPADAEPEIGNGKLPGCNHKAVIVLYHEALPTLNAVEIWNDVRQGLLRSRWREVAEKLKADGNDFSEAAVLEWWRSFFVYIGKSKFLTGRVEGSRDKPFKADLEWIIRPTNFAKIIEKKYHGG